MRARSSTVTSLRRLTRKKVPRGYEKRFYGKEGA